MKPKMTNNSHPKRKVSSIIFNQTTLVLVLFAICLFVYLEFGFYHLTQFETTDESLWIMDNQSLLVNADIKSNNGRIQKYWTAMANNKWSSTRVNDKPGVSLAYVSGLGYLFRNDPGNLIDLLSKWSLTYNLEAVQKTLFNFRMPLIIFTGLISVFFFAYFWRLSKNKWFALVCSGLILLSPTLVGISQIVNPDTLLWPFSFASILSFFVFMRYGRFVDCLLSAIFFGFALLSKYVALILVPFYLLAALIYLFFELDNLEKKGLFIKRLRQISIGYPFLIAGGIGIFALLMPALIVKQGLLYKSTLGFGSLGSKLIYVYYINVFLIIDAFILKGFFTKWLMKKLKFLKFVLPRLLYFVLLVISIVILYNYTFADNFLNIGKPSFRLHSDPLEFFVKSIASQVSSFIFSLTPMVLALLIFIWIKSIVKRSKLDWVVFSFSLFFIIYWYAMYVQNVKMSIRYYIILYPMAITLAAVGFYELTRLIRIKNRKSVIAILAVAVIFFNGASLWKSKPFYFNYLNDLLPKQYSFSKAWGYGGYEAAQYINSELKGQVDKVAWSDYDGFCPFFDGKCLFQNSPKWAQEKILVGIDYYVISAQGEKKNSTSFNVLQQKYPNSLVWELNIDGRPDNYLKIYKVIKEE